MKKIAAVFLALSSFVLFAAQPTLYIPWTAPRGAGGIITSTNPTTGAFTIDGSSISGVWTNSLNNISNRVGRMVTLHGDTASPLWTIINGGTNAFLVTADGRIISPSILFTNSVGTISNTVAGSNFFFRAFTADGASAVAATFDTANLLANNAALLVRFRNQGTNRFAVSPKGALTFGVGDAGTIETFSSGSVAFGKALGAGALIAAYEDGAVAGGYADTGAGNMLAQGKGSVVLGYVKDTNSVLDADSFASVIFGSADGGGNILSGGEGSIAQGFATGTDSIIDASADGSSAAGMATLGGKIEATQSGAMARGYATDSTSLISATGFGSFALGYASGGGEISVAGNGSLAGGNNRSVSSEDASFTWGNNVQNDGNAAMLFGKNYTNATSSAFVIAYNSLNLIADASGISTAAPTGSTNPRWKLGGNTNTLNVLITATNTLVINVGGTNLYIPYSLTP